jgi:hypothetical protein
METHAHHLHKAPGSKFWHYFFEFFMLFLAITAGFYAENIRESIKDKERLHSDMRSILSDLNSDVNYIDSVLARNEYSCRTADSLITLLNTDRSNTSEIYFLARSTTANIGYFYSNSRTFDQMKSSGTFKLVQPRTLLDSLAGYYVTFQWLLTQGDLQKLKLDQIHIGNAMLFNAGVFNEMMNIDYTSFRDGITHIRKPEGNPPLLSTDLTKINTVALNYHYYVSTVRFYDRTARFQRSVALHLIELIKKEYTFD